MVHNFISLPAPISDEDLAEIKDLASKGKLSEEASKLLSGYMAALMRLQLAELALYRGALLAADMAAEIDAGKRRRAGPPSPEGIANMHVRYVRDYVVPVLEAVREATSYTPGSEAEGRYMLAEDVRAKLVGNVRAKERIAREGYSGLPE